MTQYEPGFREHQAAYGGERYGEWGPAFEGRERFGGGYPREGRFEGSYGTGGWGYGGASPAGSYGYGGYTGEAGGRFGGGYNPGGSFTSGYGGYAPGQTHYGGSYAPSGYTGTARFSGSYGPGRREFGPGEFERREWTAPAYGPESRSGWGGERPWGYENRRFEGGPAERYAQPFETGRWGSQEGSQFGERRYGPY